MKLIKTQAFCFAELETGKTIEDAKQACLQHYSWHLVDVVVNDAPSPKPTEMTFSTNCIVVELKIPSAEVNGQCWQRYYRQATMFIRDEDQAAKQEAIDKNKDIMKKALDDDHSITIHIVNLCNQNYFYYTTI